MIFSVEGAGNAKSAGGKRDSRNRRAGRRGGKSNSGSKPA